MPVPQLTIFLTPSGDFRAELPAQNGARQGLPLPKDFATKNPEIAAALRAQAARIQEHDDRLSAASAAARKREQEQRDLDWYENLTRAERDRIRASADHARSRLEQVELDRAKRVWAYTATHHSIDLANRVIEDPKRRPKASKVIAGRAVILDW